MRLHRGEVPNLIVPVGGAALVRGGAADAVAVQAEEGAESTKLKPPDNQLLKIGSGGVSAPVAWG